MAHSMRKNPDTRLTRDPMDLILDTGPAQDRLMGWVESIWHDGSQNSMFFHGLLAKFWQKIMIKLSFFTNILLPEQVKKLVHSVHESVPFYLT